MNKFIQPVSMRVTQEQYERDLREPLLAMGYEELKFYQDFNSFCIITNNYNGVLGDISNMCEECKNDYDRHFIPEYNPEYFLAVAAMTNESYGIIGEWWKFKSEIDFDFTKNNLYKCVIKDDLDDMPLFEDKNGEISGYEESKHFWYFTKATLSDLINHFECKIDNNKNTMELTQQEKDTLAKLITKDNEAIFEKLGVKRDKNPIGVLKNDSHAKEEIAKYVVKAINNARKINKPELIYRAFTMSGTYSDKYKFVLHEKDGLQVLAIEEK
jgi:ribosomal protein S6